MCPLWSQATWAGLPAGDWQAHVCRHATPVVDSSVGAGALEADLGLVVLMAVREHP